MAVAIAQHRGRLRAVWKNPRKNEFHDFNKGRDKRPAFDKLCRDAARREFDIVMAWSVDRLGQPAGFGRLPVRAARTQDRSIPALTGARHHDAGRQGDVSDDGRIC